MSSASSLERTVLSPLGGMETMEIARLLGVPQQVLSPLGGMETAVS